MITMTSHPSLLIDKKNSTFKELKWSNFLILRNSTRRIDQLYTLMMIKPLHPSLLNCIYNFCNVRATR